MRKWKRILISVLVIVFIGLFIFALSDKVKWKDGLYLLENDITIFSGSDHENIPIKFVAVGKKAVHDVEKKEMVLSIRNEATKEYDDFEYEIKKQEKHGKYHIFILSVKIENNHKYDEIALSYDSLNEVKYSNCKINVVKMDKCSDDVFSNVEIYCSNDTVREIICVQNASSASIKINQIDNEMYGDLDIKKSAEHEFGEDVNLLDLKEDTDYELGRHKEVLYEINGNKIIVPCIATSVGNVKKAQIVYEFTFDYSNDEILELISGDK